MSKGEKLLKEYEKHRPDSGEISPDDYKPMAQGGAPHKFRGKAHEFRPPATSGACGYGHSSAQCKGPLRMSGNPSADRIGRR
jgi:hypothetical protein